MELSRINEIVLAQEKRGFDKYALAPFLLYVGIKYKKLPKNIRRILVAASLYQFMYNYKDYLQLQQDAGKLVKSIKEV